MVKKVVVVLAGCGHVDGSEIREAVLTLLALDRAGANFQCAAPDKPQMHVVNHLTRTPTPGESRNVLIESARIARGNILPLSAIRATDYDAIMLPGGYGAAKNLCTFAVDGAAAKVDSEVARVLNEFLAAGKPIGAVCIGPAIVVAALRQGEVTIGDDPGTAEAITEMGGENFVCPVEGIHVDHQRKIVTSPAYMYGDARLSRVADGIDAAVRALLALV